MFLRRGRFRGREHGSNTSDRGSGQRRFERRGSAPASIEHGAAPGVASAEDDHATNPRDSSHTAQSCSRRAAPSYWGGTSERMRRGASRIFALSVQELNTRSQVDLMSQYGRGDCGSPSSDKPIDGGVTVDIVPPVCVPPEQPGWGKSFSRMHSHNPTPRADDNRLGSGTQQGSSNLQRSPNGVDSVDRSEKLCTSQCDVATHHSQGAQFQSINNRTHHFHDTKSTQMALDGTSPSDHPVDNVPKRSSLNEQRIETDSQSPTWKPASLQRDTCQIMPSKNSYSSSINCNRGRASRQRGSRCDSPDGDIVVRFLPLVGHSSEKKTRKKNRDNRSKRQINSEAGHNATAENLSSREQVVVPETKCAGGRWRQASSEYDTSFGRRERVVDPKMKAGVSRSQQNNTEKDNCVENQVCRDRVADHRKKTGGVERRQAYVMRTNAGKLNRRERVDDSKMETGAGYRKQTNSGNAEELGSREKIVGHKEKPHGAQRRQRNVEHRTFALKLGYRERDIDPKEKVGITQKQQNNFEGDSSLENLGKRDRVVDPKIRTSTGRRHTTFEQGINAMTLGSKEKTLDTKERVSVVHERENNLEHDINAEVIVPEERVINPKKKAGGAQRQQTNSKHKTDADINLKERIVDSKLKVIGPQRKQSNSEHDTSVENLKSREIIGFKNTVQRKEESSVYVALRESRHELEQSRQLTERQTALEDENDWNMDHYGVSLVSSLVASPKTLPVTQEKPSVSATDESSVFCRNKDTGEKNHVAVCDIDSKTAVTSHDTSQQHCHDDSIITSCCNTNMPVYSQVHEVVTDVCVSERLSNMTSSTNDGTHHSMEPPMNGDIAMVGHDHSEASVTLHDLTARDSYSQMVDLGSSFYLSAAGHSYHSRLTRPCARGTSPMHSPNPRLWSHRRSSYDYLPVMPLSPPEDTGGLEDATRVNGFKRHKSGNQSIWTGKMNTSPPDTLQQPSYPGCAPFPPACCPRYPPPPQLNLHGGGPESSTPPSHLMYVNNTGQTWPRLGCQPSHDWYCQGNPPEGWYAPVHFQNDAPPAISSAQTSSAPFQSPPANPLAQNLQLLASCLVPPPPPPSDSPPKQPLVIQQSEEKPTTGCYSLWPTTQPPTAPYMAHPLPCQVFHYEAPSVRYDKPTSLSRSKSCDDTQNNVKAKETPSQHDDNQINILSRNCDSLAVSKEVVSGLASTALSKSTQPALSYECKRHSDAMFNNYVNDGSLKNVAGHKGHAMSPTSQNDDCVGVSSFEGDDSLANDSLMTHCADMAISMTPTTGNCLHGTVESRGKVKFRVAHYVPPAMRLSSSFSTVNSVESVSHAPPCPKDVNTTLPNLSYSGRIDTSYVTNDNKQESTSSNKTHPSPRCSPYGPWQGTSTPVTQAEPSAHAQDGATNEFTFQTPRRKSAPCAQVRRLLVNGSMGSVTPPKGDSKNNSTSSLTCGAQNSSHDGMPCRSMTSSVDSDLNLCGLGSSVESSPSMSQRVSRFSCCSVSSNNSQETWSELSVSFDDVTSPGKVDVTNPREFSKKEEGEIDWFDGRCNRPAEKSHNRYEMFPVKQNTPNGLYLGSSFYGGSCSSDLQTNYTNHSRRRCNLPPRMQRLLQESAAASRAQSLVSKIQQPTSANAETRSDHASSWQSFDWHSKLKEIFEKSSEQFLDSHCHLDFLFDRTNFKGTFKKYIAINEDTFCGKFAGCVTVFCHPHTFTTEAGMWTDVLREDNVWGAVGCHPKCATNFTARAERAMKVMLKHDKMVAVGEIGLDYSGTFYQHHEVQKEVLARQLKLATEINKPIVIHSRESESDIISELEKHVPRNHKIHRHCFTGTWEEARIWLHKFPNSYIGLTALLTHRSRRAFPLKDVARYIPLDKLLIETDTPYFVPWRIPKTEMEFCHPGMVITVADEVAKLKGIHINVVLKACYENTRDMYGI